MNEAKLKVIIHYLDGSTYTHKGVFIDCWVDWDKMEVALLGGDDGEYVKGVYLTEDTLAIEQVAPEGPTFWTNPRYKASIKTSVMTAKQRAKVNNPKSISGYLNNVLDGTGLVAVPYNEYQDLINTITGIEGDKHEESY